MKKRFSLIIILILCAGFVFTGCDAGISNIVINGKNDYSFVISPTSIGILSPYGDVSIGYDEVVIESLPPALNPLYEMERMNFVADTFGYSIINYAAADTVENVTAYYSSILEEKDADFTAPEGENGSLIAAYVNNTPVLVVIANSDNDSDSTTSRANVSIIIMPERTNEDETTETDEAEENESVQTEDVKE
jgi:hypothetical protein